MGAGRLATLPPKASMTDPTSGVPTRPSRGLHGCGTVPESNRTSLAVASPASMPVTRRVAGAGGRPHFTRLPVSSPPSHSDGGSARPGRDHVTGWCRLRVVAPSARPLRGLAPPPPSVGEAPVSSPLPAELGGGRGEGKTLDEPFPRHGSACRVAPPPTRRRHRQIGSKFLATRGFGLHPRTGPTTRRPYAEKGNPWTSFARRRMPDVERPRPPHRRPHLDSLAQWPSATGSCSPSPRSPSLHSRSCGARATSHLQSRERGSRSEASRPASRVPLPARIRGTLVRATGDQRQPLGVFSPP